MAERKVHKSSRRVAAFSDPTIVAAVGGFFRFQEEVQARRKLDNIRRRYILSREQDKQPEGALPTVRLWISGYEVTPAEREAGYRGHFARIAIRKLEGERYTLIAEKLLTSIDHHPQKKRPPARHPNKGHPILRAARKAKTYASVDAARVELVLLHEEFPDATIPGPDTLHVLVYNRKAEGAAPIQKVTLHIKQQENGMAQLILVEKSKRPPRATIED